LTLKHGTWRKWTHISTSLCDCKLHLSTGYTRATLKSTRLEASVCTPYANDGWQGCGASPLSMGSSQGPAHIPTNTTSTTKQYKFGDAYGSFDAIHLFRTRKIMRTLCLIGLPFTPTLRLSIAYKPNFETEEGRVDLLVGRYNGQRPCQAVAGLLLDNRGFAFTDFCPCCIVLIGR